MLPLTLKQLRYVEAAGRTRSISAAAEDQNISESSIASAIGALEASLGFDLFSRVPSKGINPSPAGWDCLKLISKILREFDEFQTELLAIGGNLVGTVRLACFASATSGFLPAAIESFQQEYPGVTFKLVEGSMDAVIDHIDSGLADIAFSYEEVTTEAHQFNSLVSLPHYALLPSRDPLSQKRGVSLKDLSTRPMVNLELERTKTYYVNLLKDAGLKVIVAHHTRSAEMVRTLVASGIGFSILNARAGNLSHADGGFRAVPIIDRLRDREFGLIRPSAMRQPRVVRRFADHCLKLRAEGAFEALSLRYNHSLE
ncbi:MULTISPECIES: LysR family transcriptional regulator [unclassified Lentilitoribacter]|jgi:DNA-binding transcriptional LysR family regulator|uniref:LysR family transcriptional regulator n=1 Tax=unclassified Lentilitoribacter TaxID=2647570 RepID=UPI0013A7086A|nr:LysR family transcriptional regulator [Lentilitoribacter sp. Alg239-R112]